jgi:hypothetical protein
MIEAASLYPCLRPLDPFFLGGRLLLSGNPGPDYVFSKQS